MRGDDVVGVLGEGHDLRDDAVVRGVGRVLGAAPRGGVHLALDGLAQRRRDGRCCGGGGHGLIVPETGMRAWETLALLSVTVARGPRVGTEVEPPKGIELLTYSLRVNRSAD